MPLVDPGCLTDEWLPGAIGPNRPPTEGIYTVSMMVDNPWLDGAQILCTQLMFRELYDTANAEIDFYFGPSWRSERWTWQRRHTAIRD